MNSEDLFSKNAPRTYHDHYWRQSDEQRATMTPPEEVIDFVTELMKCGITSAAS